MPLDMWRCGCTTAKISFAHSRWDYRNKFDYDDMMLHSEFALIIRGNGFIFVSLEAIAAGAIPVIVADHCNLPFQSFLNWKDFAFLIPEHEMLDIPNILKSISKEQRKILRCNLFKAWKHHLRDIAHHVNSALEVVSRRIYGFEGAKVYGRLFGSRWFIHKQFPGEGGR